MSSDTNTSGMDVVKEADQPDWALLPGPCRQALVQHLDSQGRAAWRLTHQQACQDVNEAQGSLSIWSKGESQQQQHHQRITLLPLVSKLPRLQSLSVFSEAVCSIQGLPAGLQTLALFRIHNIQDFSPLQNCTALRTLALATPEDQHAEVSAAMPVVQTLTSLQHVSLLDLSWPRPAAEALAPAVVALTQLQVLVISGSNSQPLGSTGMAVLAPAIGKLTGLKDLCLSNQAAGPQGAVSLSLSIENLTSLQGLRPGGQPAALLGCCSSCSSLATASSAHILERRCQLDPWRGHLRPWQWRLRPYPISKT